MKRFVPVLMLMCILLSSCTLSEKMPTEKVGTEESGFNPDIYARIRIPGSGIDYPIVQHRLDDSYYLNHDVEGEISDKGAIFTESAYNSETFDDPITVIYGNRTKTGDMFGRLQLMFSEENALEKYGEIIISLPERELRYTVFAACSYDDRHIMYNYGDSSERSMTEFLDSLTSQRRLDTLTDCEKYPQHEEKLIVLSTSLYGDNDRRFIVAAKQSD